MKLAFSSLACMEWPLEKVATEAGEFGYDGVELRGKEYRHLDPAMDPDQRRKVRDLFAASGLEIPCVTAYTRLTMADPEERKKSVETLKEQVQLAADLGARFVRTFGGPIPAGVELPDCLDYVASSLREVGEWAADYGVEVLLETHDDFSLSERVAEVMRKVDHPNVGVLWDVLHPVRFGEAPEETLERIGSYVRFVHLKDARRAGIGEYWPLTLLGRGEVPLQQIVKLLMDSGYDDYLCFEWEKPWHPEIEESEVALPHAVAFVEKFIADSAK